MEIREQWGRLMAYSVPSRLIRFSQASRLMRNIMHMLRGVNPVRAAVIATAVIWFGLSAWHQSADFDTSYYYKKQYYVASATDKKIERDLAERTCWGTFEQRYDCRSSIRLANQRKIFAVWVQKFLIVFGPPIILLVGYRFVTRPRPAAVRRKT